jgi:glutamate formiminotransferase
LKDWARRPDVGGPELHATAGASAVGARTFLIAYNIYLAPGADISHARAIAREVRASSGGMQGVKALGLLAHNRAQVSMNITDFRLTPMSNVFANLELVAREHGTHIAEGELIGLIPEAAYDADAAWVRVIPNFDADEKILERKLNRPLAWPEA